MATKIMMFKCPRCHKEGSAAEAPKFCFFCGYKLANKNIKMFTRPVCPSGIPKGHCDKCQKGKYKKCDDCGGTEKVEYRPQWENKCLCWPCREQKAILESMGRSY